MFEKNLCTSILINLSQVCWRRKIRGLWVLKAEEFRFGVLEGVVNCIKNPEDQSFTRRNWNVWKKFPQLKTNPWKLEWKMVQEKQKKIGKLYRIWKATPIKPIDTTSYWTIAPKTPKRNDKKQPIKKAKKDSDQKVIFFYTARPATYKKLEITACLLPEIPI